MESRRGFPSWAVLICGALATGVCLLLLFGPFYPDYGTPGETIRIRLLTLFDGREPRFVADLLWNRFFLSTTVVLGVILMLLPWRGARKHRHRGTAGPSGEHRSGAGPRSHAGAARVSVTERTTSVTFSDDGRVLDPADPDAEIIERSVADLRAMARAARIPWRTDYETSGGARAFLEVLRALGTGPVGVRRGEEVRAGASGPRTAAEPAVSAGTTAATAGRAAPTPPFEEPQRGTTDVDVADVAAAGTSGTSGSSGTAVRSAAGTVERLSADESSSSTGSVYTPTTLYRSTTWDRDAEEDPDEKEQR